MTLAVLFRLRAELRASSRALVALALLAALPGGVVIASIAGAHRTETVIDRLNAASRGADIFMVPAFQDTQLAFDDILRLPVVAEGDIIDGFPVQPPAPDDLEIYAPHRVGEIARTNVVAGRLPDPARPDEGAITFRAARRFGWGVGDRVPVALVGRDDQTISPEPIRITGIVAEPGDFVGVAGPGLHVTRAFGERYRDQARRFEVFSFRLHRGSADLPSFQAGIERLSEGKGILYVESQSGLEQVRRGFRLQAAALRAFAAALALALALVFAQAIARQASLESTDYVTLRALGMGPRSLAAVGVARAAVLGVGAATGAILAGGAMTWLTPLGTARLAEPDPGPWIPVGTFAIAGVIVCVTVLVAGVLPAWRAARPARSTEAALPVSPLVSALARATRRATASIGVRLALEPGRGASAVPVRSSLGAAITGVAVLVAALGVGASIRHLLNTPELYGSTWDAIVEGDFRDEQALRGLTEDRRIEAVAAGFGSEGAVFRIRGVAVEGIAFESVKGTIAPTILDGREPSAPGEIALGRKTMQQTGVRIGESVDVTVQGIEIRRTLRVVGAVVLPLDDDIATVGDGLWTTPPTILSLLPDEDTAPDVALVRAAEGADRDALFADIAANFDGVAPARTPGTVANFARVTDLMVAMAGLLALFAGGTLAHMLTSSVRRRRRDLAILRAIGFTRAQVRSTVRWQALVFAAAALIVALPVGIALGRWGWAAIALEQGFASAPIVRPAAAAAVAVGTLALSGAVAVLPARHAARIPTGDALRVE